MLRHTLAVWGAVADRANRLPFAALVRRCGFAVLLLLADIATNPAAGQPVDALGTAWRSPCNLAFSPDGNLLAVSDRTGGRVVLFDPGKRKLLRETVIQGQPAGLAWSGGRSSMLVAEYGAGTVAEFDPRSGKILRRLPVGLKPLGLAVANRRALLLVTHAAPDIFSVINLNDGKERARIPIPRQAESVAVTPDESLVVMGGFLPAGPASDPDAAAVVSVIDLDKLARLEDIRLPPGSTTVRGVTVSPDGHWAYLVHTVGRFNVPTTQIERGWINTNALSLIDLVKREHVATVLLDSIASGAADPWGVVVSHDGTALWVSLSGIHQLARIDLAGLHDLLDGKLDARPWLAKPGKHALGSTSIWQEIRDDRRQRVRLVDEPGALDAAKLIARVPLPGKGPRGLALRADGALLAVAIYYSGAVALLDPRSMEVSATLPLADSLPPDAVRRGEIAFHDATLCLQQWMSCATCHPGGHVDGLNWDLLNDGINNPKNTKSLLWSHKTPPAMFLGVRANMEVASEAGFRRILFREAEPVILEDTRAYLRSLRPEPSPYRQADGSLLESAKRGQAIFDSEATGCRRCHPAPLFTDLRSYDVGTAGPSDPSGTFDTPALVELWRTAPYLHDGSSLTLRDVLTTRNGNDRHGATSQLSKEQIDDLVVYLLSQ
jgi:DNA-binding beta-propeller fold protein YncE/mono/diheme cytochrome c family protein